MKRIIVILILLGFLVPNLSLAETSGIPENMDEIKTFGQKLFDTIVEKMPGLIKDIFKGDVMPIWQKMYAWFKANIWPHLKNLFDKYIKPEIDKRRPMIGDEFKKEKKEIKTDLPKTWDYLWAKFKDLISTD